MTTTEPPTHYTPSPAGSPAGDTVVACGTARWGLVTGDLAHVTCEPCTAAAPDSSTSRPRSPPALRPASTTRYAPTSAR